MTNLPQAVQRTTHSSGPISPLLIADWTDVVFIHFRVDRVLLQQAIPFTLDTLDGDAFVSLVAFTQRRMRPARGGRVLELLSAPLAMHEFLNLRTYVRVRDVRGIYFIAEWISNRIAQLIGPRTYGLPYRLGRLRYRYDSLRGLLAAEVVAREGRMTYRARILNSGTPDLTKAGSFDEFVLERYTGFTHRAGVTRRFDIAHPPWSTVPLEEIAINPGLVNSAPGCFGATLVGGHFSTGATNVTIGRPVRLSWVRR